MSSNTGDKEMYESEFGEVPTGWSKVGQNEGPDWDAVRAFARQALIFHDREVGLEAEIWRYKHEVHELRSEVFNLRKDFENSLSWKIGRAILWPTRLFRRAISVLRKTPTNSTEKNK